MIQSPSLSSLNSLPLLIFTFHPFSSSQLLGDNIWLYFKGRKTSLLFEYFIHRPHSTKGCCHWVDTRSLVLCCFPLTLKVCYHISRSFPASPSTNLQCPQRQVGGNHGLRVSTLKCSHYQVSSPSKMKTESNKTEARIDK